MAGDLLRGFTAITGTNTEPLHLGFTDAMTHNFLLKKDSRLMLELPTFSKILFDNIGLIKDNVCRELPVRE